MTYSTSSSISIPNKRIIIVIVIVAVLVIAYFVWKWKTASAPTASTTNNAISNPYNLNPQQLAFFNSLPNADAKAQYIKSIQPSNSSSSSQIATNLTNLGDNTVVTPPAPTPAATPSPAPSTNSGTSSGGSGGGSDFTLPTFTPLQGAGYASAYVQVPPIDPTTGCDADGNDVNGVPC
jgi:cytoskeletal protein RodZ